MNDSKTVALTDAQQAIAAIELGSGSEHFRYGRETMQDDAIRAVGALGSGDEQFCPKCFAGMDAANHDECVDVRRTAMLALMEKHQVGAHIPDALLKSYRSKLADDLLRITGRDVEWTAR
jgi:hypothetical protein